MTDPNDLLITVHEIKGSCPVYQPGESFTVAEGFKLKAEITLCMHSLASILPYYITLSKGTPPGELGLGEGPEALVQCLDPCEYTGGGTVTFTITRAKQQE